MLYKRSSFLNWLQTTKDCTLIPIKHNNSMRIENGPASAYMWMDKNDRIDYEEIWLICNKLYIDGLPGNGDLQQTK